MQAQQSSTIQSPRADSTFEYHVAALLQAHNTEIHSLLQQLHQKKQEIQKIQKQLTLTTELCRKWQEWALHAHDLLTVWEVDLKKNSSQNEVFGRVHELLQHFTELTSEQQQRGSVQSSPNSLSSFHLIDSKENIRIEDYNNQETVSPKEESKNNPKLQQQQQQQQKTQYDTEQSKNSVTIIDLCDSEPEIYSKSIKKESIGPTKPSDLHTFTNSESTRKRKFHNSSSSFDIEPITGEEEALQSKIRKKDRKSLQREYKYVATVRKKDERERLQATTCEHCRQFYDALGLDNTTNLIQTCSRHRHLYTPPPTPPEYWQFSFPPIVETQREDLSQLPSSSCDQQK